MAPRVAVINENYKISINFVNIGEKLDRNSLIVDDVFASIVALDHIPLLNWYDS